MSVWNDLGVEAKVLKALSDVTIVNESEHHFGRPYVTAYQLAIKLHNAHPEVAEALGRAVGGSGTGSRNSLAQYLAQQLSQRINRAGAAFPVEGTFLSNDGVTALTYAGADGQPLTSSLTGSGYDLSMFRRR